MQLETLGHATLVLREDDGSPILFTDPWLTGSCYWRSWWLQHYPGAADVRALAEAPFAYVTHEHPDHFHTPSIRRLGAGPMYLCPDLPEEHMAAHLLSQGRSARVVPRYAWTSLRPDVHLLSLPLFNDDSVLVLDAPEAVIVDLNDAKPSGLLLRALRRFLDQHGRGRRRVVLSSYSSASIVNSIHRAGERISLLTKEGFVRKVSDCCRALAADHWMPFASQAVFQREDSRWANEFSVRPADLRQHWTASETRLLPCYSRFDLASGAVESVPESAYHVDEALRSARLAEQHEKERPERFDDEDVRRLEEKLRRCVSVFGVLFPRGIGFAIGERVLTYQSWRGRIRDGVLGGDFVLRVPPVPFKQALAHDHVGDLGITMFVEVELRSRIDARMPYALFLLLALDDYGHTTSPRGFCRWVGRSAGNSIRRIPSPPRSLVPSRPTSSLAASARISPSA
jgi:UDP-MurNAc hydroxylase